MTDANSKLNPIETVQKMLVSTTSSVVGVYEKEGLVITHALPNIHDAATVFRMHETPVSRSGLIIAFETEPVEKRAGIVIPDYTYIGETICAYLSVLFGKRFDCHGLVEANGHYQVPDVTAYSAICDPRLPFNSHVQRTCYPIPLDLNQFSSIENIFFSGSEVDEELMQKLGTICKLYMQSLQNAERAPETSYLNLITAGEILSTCYKYSEEEMFDEEILKTLAIMRNKMERGETRAKMISARLTSVKRAFVKSLCSLLDDSFYTESESETGPIRFEPETIEKNIGAAYDLRSKSIHTGASFGRWINYSLGHSDLHPGRPLVYDSKFGKILEKAPNLFGLERLMRYCILNFMYSRELLAVSPQQTAQ